MTEQAQRNSAEAKLHEAVFNARVARHHPECVCCQYRAADREGFCNPAEWRYHSMIDRLIDKVRQLADTGQTPDATAIQQ